jgi:phosphoglycolate phosphatase
VTRYRHVVWDWNGTLLDDLDIVVDIMNRMLRRRNLPVLTHERYRDIFGFPVRNYYEAAGLDLVAEPFAVLAEEWVAGFQARWRTARLHLQAPGVIDAVRRLGVSQSVLSAAEQTLLGEQAAHFGMADRFARLVGIDNHHAESKLARGAEWLTEVGCPLDRVLLVGDTTHDHAVAVALGIDVVLVDDGHQSRERLDRCGVPVFNSLDELVAPDGPLPVRSLGTVV